MTPRIKVTVTKELKSTPIATKVGIRLRCPVCVRDVSTISPIQTSEVLEVQPHTLTRLVDEGIIHSLRIISGSQRICQDSLIAK